MIRFVFLASTLLILAACDSRGSAAELMAKAQALVDQKQFASAVIHLKNVLDKNPQSAEARLLLGRALLQGGDPVTALIDLRKAQEDGAADEQVVPEIARALLVTADTAKLIATYTDVLLVKPEAQADVKTSLAAAHSLKGDADKARRLAADALRSQPGYAPAIVLLARLDAADGDIEGALRHLDNVLARDAGNEGAGLLKGEMLLRAKDDPGAAIEVFRKVRAAHPDSVAAHTAVVNVLIQQDKIGQAKSELEPLKKRAPRHPDTLFLQAQLAFADNDLQTSRDTADQLLAVMPDNVRVLVLAGAIEHRLQRYTLAQGLLGRALKLAPQLPATRQLLAQALLRDGLADKAIEVLQPLVDSPKVDATTLALAAEAYLQAGDSKRSDAAFQRALKLAPADPKFRTSLAVAQLSRGDSGPALAQLQSIAEADSGTTADLALVSARLRHNDLKGALAAIAGLEKKVPGQAFPLVLRGRVLAQQGDVAGAAQSFEQALIKEPKYFPATAGLAAIDFKSGQTDRGRQRFLALIKADPKNYLPRLALAEFDTRMGAAEVGVIAQLKEATKADVTQPEPHLMLIERLMSSGDSQGALLAAQDATALLQTDLKVMDALGRAQLGANDGQRAVSTFKKLANLEPRNPLHQMRLADAFMANKDRTAAAHALRQALAIDPDNFLAQRGLALQAAADQRPAEGLGIARAMQLRFPKAAAGFALEGEVEAISLNWSAAAVAYRAALTRGRSTDLAVKLHGSLSAAVKGPDAQRMAAEWQRDNPQDAAFAYYLADQAATAKDWANAEARYRTVLALQPRNAAALNNIAWILATQRKPGAVAAAEQANALMPERAQLLDTLALAQEAENQLSKAVATQKRAAELDPKDPLLKLHLAKLYIKSGDKSGARKELESLARLGSGFAGQSEVASLLKSLG